MHDVVTTRAQDATAAKAQPISELAFIGLKPQLWKSALAWAGFTMATVAAFGGAFLALRYALLVFVEYLYRANYSGR